ncbi:MAG: sulfite exporter TauE/SafE family protein [Nitriliruptor sp.]|uniref:sulfite exporter TauE/SafE family protein n=1 Tax=Nitriliruptor sp. TaxID=2448056 RepID=UPI0034A0169C
MEPLTAALLLLAAVGAGAMNAVVGAGTLITFPTLLAAGFPPVVANVSNTVGLVPGGLTAAFAFRSTLTGRARLVRRLIVASSVGGLTGGALLLFLPPGAFELVVPPLLVLSGVLAALQPRVAARVAARRRAAAASDAPEVAAPVAAAAGATAEAVGSTEAGASIHQPKIAGSPLLLASIAATGIYGGYFGAAQGVILLAILGVFVGGDMTEVNGIKNVLASVANIVSALLFIAIADIDWTVAGLVAVGSTIGGALGGRYGRRLRPGPLRVLVVTVAFVAAAWQLTR